MLASFAGIENSRRHNVELPLIQVQRIQGGLVLVGQEGEHVDAGLSPWSLLVQTGLGVPGPGLGAEEGDRRKSLLMPALDVGRRLDLDGDALGGPEVLGRPLLPNPIVGHAQGLSHEVLG